MSGHKVFTNKIWDDGVQVSCLRVPLYTQPDTEPLCVAYCVKMILSYYRNIYPSKTLRKDIKDLTIDEIVHILGIKEDGWTIEEKRLQHLSDKVGALQFVYSEENDVSVLRDNLNNQKPKIVIFDKYYLDEQDYGWLESMWHSAVLVGLEDDERWVVLNDPWGKGYDRVPLVDFYEAWNRAYRSIIDVVIRPKQTTLEESYKNTSEKECNKKKGDKND